jgi:dTDP-4-amino-4,6-dideoxygalactose transaminase
MKVPFLDLARIHEPLADALTSSFREIVVNSSFTNGPQVRAFERAFADWVGTRFALGCASGLDAEVIMLRAAGLRPGDRVIVPAMTFIASVEALTAVGCEPILVDVDAHGLLDLALADIAARDGARAILPVHLFGHMVDPTKLEAVAARHGLLVLEDACQAHGAARDGRRAGTLGVASAFSFYPGKNLGAFGDAGAICTDSEEVLRISTALREHGQTAKYYHEYEGYTARLDTIQAAVLSHKLPCLDAWNAMRITAARRYAAALEGLPDLSLQSTADDGSHVYHLYVVLSERRDALTAAFKDAGIGFGLHYPIPIHQLACYAGRSWATGSFPMAEKYATRGISLPIFPGIREEEIDAVVRVVKSVHGD